MISTRLQRGDMQPGFEFIHLGTLYVVVRFDKERNTVIVFNPVTGWQSEYSFSLIRKNGRRPIKETGINNVAACLVSRKVRSMMPGVSVKIEGEGMNHRIVITLPGGRTEVITSAWQWFRLRLELMNGRQTHDSNSISR